VLASAGPFIDLDRLISSRGPSIDAIRIIGIAAALAFCALLVIGMYATRNDVR